MGQHDYFEALCARPEHWRSASLRSDAQLAPPGVVYDPAMEAAKVTIPAFFLSDALDGSIDEIQVLLPINDEAGSIYPKDRVFKVGTEIMKVVARVSPSTVQVTRGAFGTTPTQHTHGAFIFHATNNLKQQARVSLGTEDGSSYLFTWDTYFTESFLGMNLKHKAFQFTSGGPDAEGQIWLEPSAIYSNTYGPSYVGEHNYRWYNKANTTPAWSLATGDQVGPGTRCDPDEPQAPFPVAVRKWLRSWLYLEQRANDWDRVTAWAADEDREARHVFNGLWMSVRPTGKFPNSVLKWWVEFNSSTDAHQRLDQRNLVAYVRNFVALRDPANVPSLLIRPEAGVPSPWRPRPPRDIRVYAA